MALRIMTHVTDNYFGYAASRSCMRAAVAIVVLAGALLLAVFLTGRYIGDIRPALLPASKNVARRGEAGFPVLPPEFQMHVFAESLERPRDLEFSAEGALLVSLPREGKVVALPDKDGNGKADTVKVVIEGLSRPHGLAFYERKLFVAEETRIGRYHWQGDALRAKLDRVLFNLPAGGSHVTRALAFNRRGQMFVSLGSTCNVCYEKHSWLAAVVTSDKDGKSPRLFAKGLRNSVFLTVNPKTDELWAGDMGRDFLGDNLPPEEINIIRDGKDYGWPRCYGNKIHDTNFDKNVSAGDICAATEAPVYTYQAHAAPLGLAFIDSPQFPKEWQGDLLVAFHGSWNRSTPSGYKVVRFGVRSNTIISAEDFLTGFLQGSKAAGRPVDLIFDKQGALYCSDDKAGAVYKITRR